MLAGHDKTIVGYKVTGPRLTATQMGWGWEKIDGSTALESKCLDP